MEKTTNPVKTKRVGIYLRVSTEEQAKEGYGLETQLRHIKNEIDRHTDDGWMFDENLIYKDEGFSGSLRHRPAIDRMMNDAAKGKLDVILVWKIDRLYRNMRYLLETVELMGRCNVNFKSVTEIFDTTAVGKLIFQIFGALAEFERNLIMVRTSEGKISSAKDGNYVGGNVSFGYKITDKNGRRVLEVNEEEAEWVRKMFMWFADPSYDYSVEKIAELFTRMKVLTNNDKEKNRRGISRRKINPRGYWNSTEIRKKLRNSMYQDLENGEGEYYYNKFGKDETGKVVEKPRAEWVIFKCPAIVTKEIFQKAQEKLDSIYRQSNSSKFKYLLSGKIVCGKCGAVYTGYTSVKKTKNYRCGKNSKTKTAQVCDASQISEHILGDNIWTEVAEFLGKPTSVFERLQREYQKDSIYHALWCQKKEFETARQSNVEARQRVKEAFRRGTYTQEELDEELTSIDREIRKFDEDIASLNAQLTTTESKEAKILSVKELATKYRQHLKRLDYEDRREILQAIVKRVVITGDDIHLELRVPKAVREALNKSNSVYGVTGQD